MWKRVFSRKHPDNVSKSIRCTAEMWKAIEKLADEAGETPNAFIVLVLDQYLQSQLEAGLIEAPAAESDAAS
jgi:hypothetical protein